MDASTLIDLKEHYPQRVFRNVWGLLDDLARESRLFVCEQAVAECHDEVLVEFFDSHRSIVVPLWGFEDHLSALQRLLSAEGIALTKPSATKTEADPFVIGLALKLDGRAPEDLRSSAYKGRYGIAVSEESVRSSVKIPAVCTRLALPHLSLLQMLEAEHYSG